MSWDLAILSGSEHLTADRAAVVYASLCDGVKPEDLLDGDANVERFLTALSAQWPDLHELDDRNVDDSPWSASHDVSAVHVVLAIALPSAATVAPACIDLAIANNLHAYDPQEERLYLPDGSTQSPETSSPSRLACSLCGKSINRDEVYGSDEKGSPCHLDCMELELSGDD